MSHTQEPLYDDEPAHIAHMFGDNNFVTGGTFVVQSFSQSQSDQEIGFSELQRRVAPSASHDSSERLDPPKCHPKTREVILESIFEWIVNSEERDEWIFWLNGAAGAGKSAILQSIAERCAKAGIPLASFFLFRTDPERNTLDRLVGTIVYQLIKVIPEVKDDILKIIKRDPLIFEQSLESQFQQLVVQPLLRMPHLERLLFAIVIDGLDECLDREAQSLLIKAFGNILRDNKLPVIFLIASRQESHLEMAFKQDVPGKILATLRLDDVQMVSDDIRRFLDDKFSNIKQNHSYRHLLDESWPESAMVEEIVKKSSGQFIYASVVIGFISSPYASPATQLDLFNGLRSRSPSDGNPFANLDALYQYIFSQVKALDKVLDILAYILLHEVTDIPEIEGIFDYTIGEVEILLADLRSVIVCPRRGSPSVNIKFLHASLPDFLLDKSRSGIYHISGDVSTTRLLCVLLKTPTRRWTFYGRYRPILRLLKEAKPSEELRLALLNFSESIYDGGRAGAMTHETCAEFLKCLHRLNLEGGRAVRRHFLEIFGPKIAEWWASLHEKERKKARVYKDLRKFLPLSDYVTATIQSLTDHL
ncbi:hypothetical protein BJ912DRAFT_1144507 [Pholiota molesta]|nr:hypothetical protein BJ912DRAFT_1144507 [Pholiota molesta]